MSDAPPISWSPPTDGEPVTDRDGEPVLKRDGSPVTVREAFAEMPPPTDRPVVYHFEPHYHADPRIDEVLAKLTGLEEYQKYRERVLSQVQTNLLNSHRDITNQFIEQRSMIMATHAELRAEIDALKANVQRVADHAVEQNRKLDEMAALRDNGTEEEFAAAIAELKAENDKLAAVGAAPAEPMPAPAPEQPAEPAPAPVDAAPVPAEPVTEQPAPDAGPSLPAPDAPAADPTAPVPPGSPENPAT